MEPTNQVTAPKQDVLRSVTPLSKYLALALFIAMPFLGGWIGYEFAPEKVVEVEKPLSKNNTSETTPDTGDFVFSESTSIEFTNYEAISDSSLDEIRLANLNQKKEPYSWSRFFPELVRLATEKSFEPIVTEISNIPPGKDCEYNCQPTIRARIDYVTESYLYMDNGTAQGNGKVKFYSEERDVSNVDGVTYVSLGAGTDGNMYFIESISEGSCCDGGLKVSNRLFLVDLKHKKTTVRPLELQNPFPPR